MGTLHEKLFILYHRLQWLISVICLLFISVACARSVFNIQGIYVEELVVTSSLDEDGRPVDDIEVFYDDMDRIYCFAKVPALSNEILQAQWYYEDNLIGTVENTVSTQGNVSWFLSQPIDQPLFPKGQYRCQIYYEGVQLKRISFRVEEAE